MSLSRLFLRSWFEVRKEIERAILTTRVKAVWRAGKKSEYVRLIITVQVDDKVVLCSANLGDKLRDTSNRNQRWTIPQPNTIHFDDLVRVTRKTQQLFTRLSHSHGYPRIRKAVSDRPQRGQTHHDIAELPKINDENVTRIEHG
jgi:hypothetical protein